MSAETNPAARLRVRISPSDTHYAGGLASGAKMMELFGDLATELSIQLDGDEGLLRAYESVEFLAPVGAGDFIEARGRVVNCGNTSRRMEFEAYKVIEPLPQTGPTAAVVLAEPLLVARAVGITVTPRARQRGNAR